MLRTQPPKTALTEPWFAACARGELLLQQCAACQEYQFYPRILCTRCDSRELQWQRASGRGTIMSFTVVRRAISEAYAAPYTVILVELAEGPRMMSQLVGENALEVCIGDAVQVEFEAWDEATTLPVFRKTSGG